MNDQETIRPSAWWFGIALAAILAGFVLFCQTLLRDLPHITDNLTQLVVPGARNISLMANRTYTIFWERQSMVNGVVYSATEINGLVCTVFSQASGQKIDVSRAPTNTSYNLGERQGSSILEFTTVDAGVYHLRCDYDRGRQTPQVVLAVATGVVGGIFLLVGKALGSLFLSIFVGGGVLLTVLVMRQRSKKLVKLRQPTATSP